MVERRQRDNAPTRDLLTEFDRLHRETVGCPAVIHGGKDAKLIAGLWRSHGDELTRGLMADFFASADPWIRANGYTVGRFLAEAGKLLARRPRDTRREHWSDECQRLHGGACTRQWDHDGRLQDERAKAVYRHRPSSFSKLSESSGSLFDAKAAALGRETD